MNQSAWDQIEQIYLLPHVSKDAIKQFRALKSSQSSHTKKEGNLKHYCSFFLPYDKSAGKIYLGHHKKADDFIPPGGHIEPNETPLTAALREMHEELNTVVAPAQLTPWNLSIKPINHPELGCVAHYDVWYLVNIPVRDFLYDQGEYHSAAWFNLADGIAKIAKNPDFASIISLLSMVK